MIVRGLWISAGVIIAMAGLSIWGWNTTPADAQIPVHWSASGEVNRYGSRFEAFLMMPLMATGLCLLLAFAPKIDPRGRNLANSGPLYLAVWIGTLIFVGLAHLAMVLSATGVMAQDSPIMPRIVLLGLALFMAVIGNLLGKARPNWFVGVRTPWTLSSDLSWDVTHRWAGRGFVLAGVVGGLAMLLSPINVGLTVFFVLLGGTAIGSIILSFLIWKKDPHRETFSDNE